MDYVLVALVTAVLTAGGFWLSRRGLVRERDLYRRAKHDLTTACRAYRERLLQLGFDPDEIWPLL